MFATVDSSGAGSLDLVLYRSWLVRSQCGRTAFRSCRPSLSILEGIARGARYVLSSVLLRAKESLLPSGQAGRRARLSNPADVALQLSVPLGRAQWKPDASEVQKAVFELEFFFDFRWARPSGITTRKLQRAWRMGGSPSGSPRWRVGRLL